MLSTEKSPQAYPYYLRRRAIVSVHPIHLIIIKKKKLYFLLNFILVIECKKFATLMRVDDEISYRSIGEICFPMLQLQDTTIFVFSLIRIGQPEEVDAPLLIIKKKKKKN